MHGRPLRRTLRLPLQVVMSWAYPPPQEETANNIRGQLRSRDGILTDLKALRWESLSDGWNTTGPISLRRGSRNQWRSDGGRGGSRKKPDKLFLFKRSKKKKSSKDRHKEYVFGKSPAKDGGTTVSRWPQHENPSETMCVRQHVSDELRYTLVALISP